MSKLTKKPTNPTKTKLIPERGRGEKESGRGLVPSTSEGRLDHPFNAYLDELDPRGQKGNDKRTQEVQFALAASNDLRFRSFLDCLSQSRFKHMHLATVAKYCDISLPQFHQFWQDSQKNIALARAQNALPDLITDLTIDAATKLVNCTRCDGLGVVPDHAQNALNELNSKLEGKVPDAIKPCPNCTGTGKVKEIGNQHARDRLLEVGGLTKKDRGAAVLITQNFGGATMASAVDSLSKITFDIDPDIIDVESTGSTGTD